MYLKRDKSIENSKQKIAEANNEIVFKDSNKTISKSKKLLKTGKDSVHTSSKKVKSNQLDNIFGIEEDNTD